MELRKNFPRNVAFVYGYKPSGHYSVALALYEFMPSNIVKPHLFNLSDILPASSQFVRGYL
jgi:hypothetical protein